MKGQFVSLEMLRRGVAVVNKLEPKCGLHLQINLTIYRIKSIDSLWEFYWRVAVLWTSAYKINVAKIVSPWSWHVFFVVFLKPFGFRSYLASFQLNNLRLIRPRPWVLIYRLLIQELHLQALVIALAYPHSRVRLAEDLLVISARPRLHNLILTFKVFPI